MDGEDGFDRLDLNHDQFIDQQVDPISIFHEKVAITQRDNNLLAGLESSLREFVSQAQLIRLFQETRSDRRMDRDSGIDNCVADAIFIEVAH